MTAAPATAQLPLRLGPGYDSNPSWTEVAKLCTERGWLLPKTEVSTLPSLFSFSC